jgi:Galactose binding lectin domain
MQVTCAVPSGVVCDAVAWSETANLACPQGQVVKAVGFASYGTPTGTCGAFFTGTCNAATTKSVVEAACLGKAQCQVPATTATFGDPCFGTFKGLEVQVTCGAK